MRKRFELTEALKDRHVFRHCLERLSQRPGIEETADLRFIMVSLMRCLIRTVAEFGNASIRWYSSRRRRNIIGWKSGNSYIGLSDQRLSPCVVDYAAKEGTHRLNRSASARFTPMTLTGRGKGFLPPALGWSARTVALDTVADLHNEPPLSHRHVGNADPATKTDAWCNTIDLHRPDQTIYFNGMNSTSVWRYCGRFVWALAPSSAARYSPGQYHHLSPLIQQDVQHDWTQKVMVNGGIMVCLFRSDADVNRTGTKRNTSFIIRNHRLSRYRSWPRWWAQMILWRSLRH